MNKIYATLIVSEHFEAIKIDAKNNEYALEILSTLPETINTDELKSKSLLLTALTVVEPLLRCGEEISLCLPFDVDEYKLNDTASVQNVLDTKICTFFNLPWVQERLTFQQEQQSSDNTYNAFFFNKNTVEIFNEELALKYSAEILKTLPFAIYERMRAECDYAWPCMECPKGQNGECEAIIYEQHLQYL